MVDILFLTTNIPIGVMVLRDESDCKQDIRRKRISMSKINYVCIKGGYRNGTGIL